MRTLQIKRAQGIGDQAVPPITIVIDREIESPRTVADAGTSFAREGVTLAKALIETLPGGTVDALLGELLKKRASLLLVSFEDPQVAG